MMDQACAYSQLSPLSWLTIPLSAGLLLTRTFFATQSVKKSKKVKKSSATAIKRTASKYSVILHVFSVAIMSLWIFLEFFGIITQCLVPCNKKWAVRSRAMCFIFGNTFQYVLCYLRRKALIGKSKILAGASDLRLLRVALFLGLTNVCIGVYSGLTIAPKMGSLDILGELDDECKDRAIGSTLLFFIYMIIDLAIFSIFMWLFMKPFVSIRGQTLKQISGVSMLSQEGAMVQSQLSQEMGPIAGQFESLGSVMSTVEEEKETHLPLPAEMGNVKKIPPAANNKKPAAKYVVKLKWDKARSFTKTAFLLQQRSHSEQSFSLRSSIDRQYRAFSTDAQPRIDSADSFEQNIKRKAAKSLSKSAYDAATEIVSKLPHATHKLNEKATVMRVLRGCAVSQVAQTLQVLLRAKLSNTSMVHITRVTTLLNLIGIFITFPDFKKVQKNIATWMHRRGSNHRRTRVTVQPLQLND